MKKKFTWLLCAFTLAATMATPAGVVNADNSATIDTNEEIRINANKVKPGEFKPGLISTEYPSETKLIITKLETEDEGTSDHDGSELSDKDVDKIGNPKKGKVFRYYKVSPEQFAELNAHPNLYTNAENIKKDFPELKGVELPATDKDGRTTLTVKAEDYGDFWFIEDGMKKAAGIPFALSLPLTNTEKITTGGETYPVGTVYLQTIHIYPKNIVKPDVPGGGGGGGGDESEKFKKISDEGKKPLAGVKFVVKTRKTDRNGDYVYTAVQRDGKDYVVESGSDGYFKVNGPKNATYYLFEIVPADRHASLSAPVVCKLDGDSSDVTVIENKTIENPPEPPTPPNPPEPPTTPEKPEIPPNPNTPDNPELNPPGGGDKPEMPGINTPDTPESNRPPNREKTKITMPDTGDVMIYFMVLSGGALIYLGRKIIIANS